MWKALFVVPAVPAACGLMFLFLKLRFGLIKDEAERNALLCKWFSGY